MISYSFKCILPLKYNVQRQTKKNNESFKYILVLVTTTMSLISMGNAYSSEARRKRREFERKQKLDERKKEIEESRELRREGSQYKETEAGIMLGNFMYLLNERTKLAGSLYDKEHFESLLGDISNIIYSDIKEKSSFTKVEKEVGSLEKEINNTLDTIRKTEDESKALDYLQKKVPGMYQRFNNKILGLYGDQLISRLR